MATATQQLSPEELQDWLRRMQADLLWIADRLTENGHTVAADVVIEAGMTLIRARGVLYEERD